MFRETGKYWQEGEKKNQYSLQKMQGIDVASALEAKDDREEEVLTKLQELLY